MTIEKEFRSHYKRFHEYMSKSQSLWNLHPGRKGVNSMKSWIEAVPTANECIISLLDIKDKRIIKVFKNWENPSETADLAKEIQVKEIGGHLVADVTYLFWKYCHVVKRVETMLGDLSSNVLLEQAIVSACTAYECYLKEMIPWILRNHKNSGKRFLGTINKPIKDLGKYDFDPMKNVDKIYLEIYGKRNMPVFPDLVMFYGDIIGIALFRSKRDRDYLEKIFQMRHCIVHNEGKPDDKWKKLTNNARFRIDPRTTHRYCIKVDEKLHDAAWDISDLLKIDREKALAGLAWKKEESELDKGMIFQKGRWKHRA